MADLTMNGNAKLKTVKQQFTKRFPYLRLSIYALSQRSLSLKTPLNAEKTLAEVRTKTSSKVALVRGAQKVKNLEKMMEDDFGLYCQVCYTTKDNERFYTTGSLDDMKLSDLNHYGNANGWKKGEWK